MIIHLKQTPTILSTELENITRPVGTNNLVDNIVPATLDIYAILFCEEGLRHDAISIDSQRHSNDFMKPFVNTKRYPYTKKNIDIMVKHTALFLIEFFQNIWSNSTSPQHAPQSVTRSIKSTGHTQYKY
nr:7683_t:CDS:2 [Entrophospora candida]